MKYIIFESEMLARPLLKATHVTSWDFPIWRVNKAITSFTFLGSYCQANWSHSQEMSAIHISFSFVQKVIQISKGLGKPGHNWLVYAMSQLGACNDRFYFAWKYKSLIQPRSCCVSRKQAGSTCSPNSLQRSPTNWGWEGDGRHLPYSHLDLRPTEEGHFRTGSGRRRAIRHCKGVSWKWHHLFTSTQAGSVQIYWKISQFCACCNLFCYLVIHIHALN